MPRIQYQGNMKEDLHTLLHVDRPPMHLKHIHPKCEHLNQETGSSTPPGDRHANQIILGLLVTPPAHLQAKPHQRPIHQRGCKDVFFVQVLDECIVQRHHCNIQVPKVMQEQ